MAAVMEALPAPRDSSDSDMQSQEQKGGKAGGPSEQQTLMRQISPACSAGDDDAAALARMVDAQMQLLAADAVEQLRSVKARMAADSAAAVASEAAAGECRLASKQAELELLRCQLNETHAQLDIAHAHMQRLAGGYARKQRGTHVLRTQLQAWRVWRAYAERRRRLAALSARVQLWHTQRWLLGRAWCRWLGAARLHYRQLVAVRAERERLDCLATQAGEHEQQVAALRADMATLQGRLDDEAASRKSVQEQLTRALMRGVAALNLEALAVMRQSGGGLNASAAAGTAAPGLQQPAGNDSMAAAVAQQQQLLQEWQAGGGGAGGAASAVAQLAVSPARCAAAANAVNAVAVRSPGQQAACCDGAPVVVGAAAAAQAAGGGSATSPAAGGVAVLTAAACGGSLAAWLPQPGAAGWGASGCVSPPPCQLQQGLPVQRASPVASMAAPLPRVFVERGPAASESKGMTVASAGRRGARR